jgi:hypothetical protein
MKFISLKQWLLLFDLQNVSFKEFLKTYKVKTNTNVVSLTEAVKARNISTENVKLIYSIFVLNKKKYLTNFYKSSLELPKSLDLPSNITLSLSNSQNIKQKNLIRNLNYRDLLLNTKTGIPNLRPFLEVLIELFNKSTIDYKLITPSAIDLFKRGLFGSVMSGFYFRSSILNPAVIYTLSIKYLKGAKVFTPTLGWSSYCYGFLSDSRVKEYLGIDVIPKVCNNTKKLSDKFFPDKITSIYCAPSESFLGDKVFMKKYKNYFDIVFFSPPYYELELYPGKNQSTEKYKSYEEWLVKYWEQTIKLCRHVLKKGGIMAYIISGYANKMSLNEDMNSITKKYFKLKKKMKLGNTDVGITQHRETGELIFFFV